jgi:hypothetical protein
MTESQTLIRPLQVTDEDRWRHLRTTYLTFYETAVGEDVHRSTFARPLAGNGGAR